jgi:hypothetical protein
MVFPVPAGSTTRPALTSISGYQGTMAQSNHLPVIHESRIHTQTSIPRKKLTFCAVYGAENPILAFVSFGAECENMDIP